MSGNEQTAEERLDIAVARIASEKTARTGRLDLGNLGLTRLPTALSELHWLEELRLRGAVQRGETVYRCSVEEGWEETDETLNPNRIEDLTPLAALTALQTLYCWDAPVSNLPEAVIGLPRLKEFSIGGLPSLDEIPAEVLWF